MSKLTPDQEKALEGILEFIQSPIQEYKDCVTLLYAAAGCGKTFLTRYIADKIRGKYTIAGVAPTHKARKVLDRFLNKGSFYKIKTMTVAALLGKLRSHSYIGTKYYSGVGTKIDLYDLFIIDEASMINDEDIEKIIDYAFKYKKKIIFVGDKYQIPNPTQKFICENGIAYKADSSIFNIPGFELTTNIRQKEGNPIIPIYWEFRTAIAEKREANIERKDEIKNDIGVKFYKEKENWYLQMAEIYLNSKELHNIRVIVYTNDAVKTHNQAIRKLFGRGIKPEIGELLMGYNNIGFPEPYVSNGQDYYILDVIETTKHKILEFSNLEGLIIKIKESDTNVQAKLFVPDIGSSKNIQLLEELVKRAEKVNSQKSTKRDYKKYCDIRNKLIFMENIYKFQKEIVGETQFRCDHPLLFKNVNEVINYDNAVVLNNKLSNDIEEKYGNILFERLNDNKIFSDVEKVSDQFCIIEKDIDYGFAVTSHKSQGSSYKTVFIDEPDFEKLKNHYNYKISCDVKTVKEKNQLKYVSFTRPTDSAYVFYKEIV
jgi:Intestiviridae Dda-like helicase